MSFSELWLPKIETRLSELLPTEDQGPQQLQNAMRYAALSGGKRLRPMFCLASCAAEGGDPARALDAACAIEFVHCFSLIHDDLPALDNDELRRGKPTCHKAFGEAIAILAGDALFALAFETLSEMDATDQVRVKSLSVLARASGVKGMVGGQTVDMLSESKQVDEATVRWIHERKTGELIAASCRIGAIAAGADSSRLGHFGEYIGLGYQIADDVLEQTSSTEQLGKSASSDISKNKATFPAVAGLEESKRLAQQQLKSALDILEPMGPRAEDLAHLARIAVERKF